MQTDVDSEGGLFGQKLMHNWEFYGCCLGMVLKSVILVLVYVIFKVNLGLKMMKVI